MWTIYKILLPLAVLYVAEGAVFKGQNLTDPNAGICHLEVPTIDILPPDQRHGVIPKGNGTRAGFSKIQICCSGWKLKPHTAFRCEPICDNGCNNGNCTAPNVCVCHKNYIKSPIDSECIPTCPVGCLNGICSRGGQCSCNNGYTLDPKGQMCLPVCANGCGIGGECVAPETCQCKPGFEKSVKGLCEYYCEGGCIGGDCIGPNQCQCRPGFSKIGDSCQASCPRGCRNGICAGPNKCECQSGWTLDPSGTACFGHCDPPCLNGECSAPGTCTCKPGYIKDPFNPAGNRCVAHCPGGCENGQCSSPNFCICNIGYIKDKGTSKCVRRVRRSSFHPELIYPVKANH